MTWQSSVTHVIAPARWATYLATGDVSSLEPDEVNACDRTLGGLGDFLYADPMPPHVHTRHDPPLACFVFTKSTEPALSTGLKNTLGKTPFPAHESA